MAEFTGTRLKDNLTIKKLYSVHYFEYSADFAFEGEKHNFWEFVYADKSDVSVTAGNREILLKQGEIIFHKPGQWHTLRGDGKVAPNVVVVSFDVTGEKMSFFKDKVLKVGQVQKELISKIITEYSAAFSSPLDNIYTKTLIRRKKQPFASEQLLKSYLCELLISFIRDTDFIHPVSATRKNSRNVLINMAIGLMEQNINENLTVSDLIKYTGSNKSTLESAFHETFGTSAMQYFFKLKIQAAKKALRENNYNITQIAHMLGYSSVHYFSRQFKVVTGMSPTQYSQSIMALSNSAEKSKDSK